MQVRAQRTVAGAIDRLPFVQRVTAVLWPSALLAGAATGVFFTFLDPLQLFECTGDAPLGRLGAYSVGFFGFWLLGIASSLSTMYFLRPPPGPTRAPPPPQGT